MQAKNIDRTGALLAVIALAILPLVFESRYLIGVLTVAAIYGIWSVSWDFMSGLTGRENFGHSLFIGVGAYAAGFLNTELGASAWWSLPVGMLAAVVFALIMGFPTLRLKGPYFALAMLSGAVIMQRLMLIFWEYTGGEEGINGIEPLLRSPLHFYWLVLGILVATTLLLDGALPLGLDFESHSRRRSHLPGRGLEHHLLQNCLAGHQRGLCWHGGCAVCPLPTAGQPATVCGGDLGDHHHHGVCGRHGQHLRSDRWRLVAHAHDRVAAQFW